MWFPELTPLDVFLFPNRAKEHNFKIMIKKEKQSHDIFSYLISAPAIQHPGLADANTTLFTSGSNSTARITWQNQWKIHLLIYWGSVRRCSGEWWVQSPPTIVAKVTIPVREHHGLKLFTIKLTTKIVNFSSFLSFILVHFFPKSRLKASMAYTAIKKILW